MQKNYKLTVPVVTEKIRIDKYITQFIVNASRTKVQKCINVGNVQVNGNFVKSNYLVKPYDEIEIELPVPERQEIKAEKIPLDIVYEDNYLMLINKPAGMVTHPAYKNYSGTLVNALMYYARKKNESLSDINGFERAGIVHRLDKDTSGLLIVAKDEITHRKLSEQFFNHTIEREYNAIIWGRIHKKEGVIETKLGRDKKDRTKVTVIRNENEPGKIAITTYQLIEEYEYFSLLKLVLKTGRTHQIRVHLSSIGHPVLGDSTYGGTKPHSVNVTPKSKIIFEELLNIMKRQALHARVLGFFHPHLKQKMRFATELAEDMKIVIEKLK